MIYIKGLLIWLDLILLALVIWAHYVGNDNDE